MIRANAALTRQAQEFFHAHLVGVYSWEEVVFSPLEKQDKPEPEINRRGRKRRPEGNEGRYRAIVRMEFGIWSLKIEAPTEHPPLGWIALDGFEQAEGPLDPETWNKFGRIIKQKHEELKNVA